MTVNYVEVYTLVKEVVEEREFGLLETLAETIAGEILSPTPWRKWWSG